MNNQNLVELIESQIKKNSTQSRVFALLSDQKWHCRECEGKQIESGQYAGGGGIQGLERGTQKRAGLIIETEKKYCETCQKECLGDRWTGEIKSANAAANIPQWLRKRILEVYDYTDVIEQRKRPVHELVIDHRFPMERWGNSELTHLKSITNEEIKQKFQLLKKDAFGNHNLLKSRSCERCIQTNQRGTPFGIKFWYQGGEQWSCSYQRGSQAEEGCLGCGWYNFEIWRECLNQKLGEIQREN